LTLEGRAPALIFNKIAQSVAPYAGLSYQLLAQTVEQWPQVGRSDLYYGGTTYDNKQGIGVQLALALQRGEALSLPEADLPDQTVPAPLALLPVTRLYDRGTLVTPSTLLTQRLAGPEIWLNPITAAAFGLQAGAALPVTLSGHTLTVFVQVADTIPEGVALAPRSVGLPFNQPVTLALQKVETK
jgi:NADH-quinone oxidoreductase subunit G